MMHARLSGCTVRELDHRILQPEEKFLANILIALGMDSKYGNLVEAEPRRRGLWWYISRKSQTPPVLPCVYIKFKNMQSDTSFGHVQCISCPGWLTSVSVQVREELVPNGVPGVLYRRFRKWDKVWSTDHLSASTFEAQVVFLYLVYRYSDA